MLAIYAIINNTDKGSFEFPLPFVLCHSLVLFCHLVGGKSSVSCFRLAWTGKLARINYNEPSRVKFVNASMEHIPEIYLAYQTFTKMLYESRFLVKKKPSEGDILSLDNDRVLHGRASLGLNQTEKRWLNLAYIDRDVLNSKFELLKAKMDEQP